ncbi:uncharacterized protein C1orf131 homolog [Lineus longissimus]|uniref:uncharacterized protein C1orf131 homolog n=1 Tax=Lineus longissimus TaxID=88925 RepID=UPI002B4D2952
MSKVSKKSILKKLDSYVGSFLEDDTEIVKPKKKKTSKRNAELEKFEEKYSIKNENKKNSKKGGTDSAKSEEEETKIQKPKIKGQKRHLEFIKGFLDLNSEGGASTKELGGDDSHGVCCDVTTDRAERTLKQNERSVEVVVFEEGRSSKKRKLGALSEEANEETTEVDQSAKFNMRKARHDVQKLGITGFVKKEKKKAERMLVIKLGARPPRKNHIPYKTYMEQQRQKKDDEKKKREMDRIMGLKVKSRKGMRHKKGKGDLGFIDGQVGRFRGGVQTLTKDQIDKIKKTRLRRS